MKTKKILLFLVFILISKNEDVLAQEFNVLQVKGKKAIVEIKSNERLKKGETYFVNQNIADDGFTPKIKNNRNYLIGLEVAEFSSTKSDADRKSVV